MVDLVSMMSHDQHTCGLACTVVPANCVTRVCSWSSVGVGFCLTKPACSWLVTFAVAFPGNQGTGYLVLLRNSTCLHSNKGVRASLQLDIIKCWFLFLRCNRENSEYRSLIHNSDTSLIQATGKYLNTEACGLIIYLWRNWV